MANSRLFEISRIPPDWWSARISSRQTTLTIHRGVVHPDGGDFQPGYIRNDEEVLSVDIDHSEGNCATLSIELRNPQVGLLAPGRDAWCWLSWQADAAAAVVPLFHGRLVSVPADLQGEKITLHFIARP